MSNILVRPMVLDDVYRGFLECLASLSDTGLTMGDAVRIFQRRAKEGIVTLVAVRKDGWAGVLGTTSIIFETKYLHRGGKVAHIEDVAVKRSTQNRGIGTKLMDTAIDLCKRENCYKIILDCDNNLVDWYKGFGFRKHECQMRLDI